MINQKSALANEQQFTLDVTKTWIVPQLKELLHDLFVLFVESFMVIPDTML